tara:strand:+ start:53 stop:448 length:396 start_codon:yes stop_codon:yes gene_type:complete
MKSKSKKKYSKKKQKQIHKRNKLSRKHKRNIKSKDNKINKYYVNIALLNLYKLLYEQSDLTWGGIVDPYTYEVNHNYWSGTNDRISDYDKSRINAIAYTAFSGDPTWDFNKFYGGAHRQKDIQSRQFQSLL